VLKVKEAQMTDYGKRSTQLHRERRGKIEVISKFPVDTLEDLSLAYTPGVAAPCLEIARDRDEVFNLTIKANSVAVVTDGSAVLGLGNIGPEAALPVMEGKALLFKRYGGVDAWPICLNTQDEAEIIRTVRLLAPGFGGINLEDIAAPRCFIIERALQDLGIPVFHDDQDGTAIAVLAALMNAAKVVKKRMTSLRVVICGAGAAGIAIARLLCGIRTDGKRFSKEVILCDTKGIISSRRHDLNVVKRECLQWTNPRDCSGTVHDAMVEADVFIGVSAPNLIGEDDVRVMNADAIVMAMSNPIPEITPAQAKAGGAAIVATGRSDLPNQVNNVLVFPGLFRGLLDARVKVITPPMFIAAAEALAALVPEPTADRIIPRIVDRQVDVAGTVATAVRSVVSKGRFSV
jgi:malate dehydrogenase (oxaloacetate-decarboxylating)